MQLEVEQKYPISAPDELLVRLSEQGIELGPPIRQVDTYYQHPARNFQQTDEALRIRQVGDENCITYKGPKLDAVTKTRRELELPIGLGETSAANFAELLTALGFRPAGCVVKHRRSGSCPRGTQIVELAFDDVEGLGSFLELEIVTEDSQLDAARDSIAELACALGLESPERRSYLELVLRKSGAG